jgi:FkbM family methyltransferase
LPLSWQHELKRLHYRRQLRRQRFESNEPEFKILDRFVSAGDWAIDVGANVGHYTKRLSDLVGANGRVIALEPVPQTFALLAANVSLFQNRNVTLLNLAASDRTQAVGMRIPTLSTGLKNYYEAEICNHHHEILVVTIAIDSLMLSHRISLVKIDAEGYDSVVVLGMDQLLARDHPTLIVETTSSAALDQLLGLGYQSYKLSGSPNTLFQWHPDSEQLGVVS